MGNGNIIIYILLYARRLSPGGFPILVITVRVIIITSTAARATNEKNHVFFYYASPSNVKGNIHM